MNAASVTRKSGSDRVHSVTVRPPRQARSRATLDRILAATRELLEAKTFDEISISEIVARARSSVGAFYTRFPDKAALLDHLDELYARRMVECAEAVASERGGSDTTLVEDVRGLVTFLVRLHRIQPGLLRTLIVEARRQGEGAFRERTRRMNRTIPPVMERLLAHRDEIRHPEPLRAVYLGLLMVFSAIREVTLFPEGLAEFVDYGDEELIEELTAAYLRYLRVEDVS
jgi:AcrR family transcriptional regulator